MYIRPLTLGERVASHLAADEPPARGGYTPSVFSTLPKLLERSGNADTDMNEPVADEVSSILDAHSIVSTELARQHHWPAIDILSSPSRVLKV